MADITIKFTFIKIILNNIKLIYRDNLLFKIIVLFIIIELIFLIVGIIKWNKLPVEIPLYYSLPRSDDQLVDMHKIIILPAFSFIFFIFDLIIAAILFQKEKIGSIIILLTGVSVSLLFLITYLKIIFLIT